MSYVCAYSSVQQLDKSRVEKEFTWIVHSWCPVAVKKVDCASPADLQQRGSCCHRCYVFVGRHIMMEVQKYSTSTTIICTRTCLFYLFLPHHTFIFLTGIIHGHKVESWNSPGHLSPLSPCGDAKRQYIARLVNRDRNWQNALSCCTLFGF